MDLEEIRNDFETNGITIEFDDFDRFICECRRKASAQREKRKRPLSKSQILFNISIAETRRMLMTLPMLKKTECKFCLKNREPRSVYATHRLNDREGRVICPMLKQYRCPICDATGSRAHTRKYCPLNDWNLPEAQVVREPFSRPGEQRPNSQVSINDYAPITETKPDCATFDQTWTQWNIQWPHGPIPYATPYYDMYM